MFVGGFSNLFLFKYRLLDCGIKKRNFITLELANKNSLNCLFSVSSQASPTNIAVISFRSDACNNSPVSSSRGNDHSLLVFMHRVITKWIHHGALKLFNGFGCNFTNCHFDTCTIWGQEKNFRMFLPSSCGQSGLLRLNLLKKKK